MVYAYAHLSLSTKVTPFKEKEEEQSTGDFGFALEMLATTPADVHCNG